MIPILSHVQAVPILAAIQAKADTVEASIDLNRTTAVLPLTQDAVQLPDGQTVDAAQLEEMVNNELACYQIIESRLVRVQFYSEALSRHYSLMPTRAAPTMLVSGIPMHRIKDTDPWRDTQAKIKAVTPLGGAVLDTAMGLGYTASLAAETAVSVTTIELDPTVLDVCRANPWSHALFDNPRIERRLGDAFDVVETLPNESYARVVHDPPMFKLAGHLYSADFYGEVLRVLKPKGRMFHYIGDPTSKSGKNVTRGVIRRLHDAGFRRVKPWPQAFGVIAFK